jgi:hypothetical protein
MDATNLIDLYCSVWSEPDAERRAQLLAAVWATGATYTDPSANVRGAPELLVHIAKVQAKRPGSRVIRKSKVDHHHNIARFSWQAIEANGNALPEGLDLAFITDDGQKIERIVGFFGPLKPLSE